jgi:hypothetical protein
MTGADELWTWLQMAPVRLYAHVLAMTVADALHWAGSLTALLGAYLVGGKRHAHWGWWTWLLSNALWIAFALVQGGVPGLLVMQAGFVFTSIRGIWNTRPSLRSA